jgi:5-amino-6-(5-phosphoribosylamino)uracil reductase
MRPHVVLNCAMTLDGFLDDASGEPLRISNAADLDRVDALRASCDAILVGAETVRRDDPKLLVKSEARIAARRGAGGWEQPAKVTLSNTGALPLNHFFAAKPSRILVYLSSSADDAAARRIASAATVVRCAGPLVDLPFLADDLVRRGVKRLLVEGGSAVLTAFLAARLVDELSVAVGPFFVGDERAPRFVRPARFPFDKGHPLRLDRVEKLDDVVVLHYVVDHRMDPHEAGGPHGRPQ